ncbi:signal peptidase I [Leucobacter sp. wl10]|uniref:signal peptidase I n=1 Tax=Leucobacter sp. wl10 TaxID=2304677 RepID=UPI000E5BFFA7|nr:signal peptidase I [Leucobacter sp. wl10]RGE19794.1 signal peptidase I [Leucobacter sp. wl10]
MSEQRSRPRRILGHPLTHLFAALLILGLTQAFVVKLFMVPSGSMENTLEIGDRLLVNRLAYSLPGSDGVPEPGDLVVFSTQEQLWPDGNDAAPDSPLSWVKYGAKWFFGDLIGIGPTTDRLLVKRVIGTPGQTVECCSTSGQLLVDGEPIEEPYLFEDLPFEAGTLDCATTPRSARCFAPVTVPERRLLALGDHRSASNDGITRCRSRDGPSSESCVRWARTDDVLGEVFAVVWPLNRWGGLS